MTDWQPRETAPQGKTVFVLGRRLTGEPWWNIGYLEDGEFIIDGFEDPAPWQRPTHWMPLPPPPAGAA